MTMTYIEAYNALANYTMEEIDEIRIDIEELKYYGLWKEHKTVEDFKSYCDGVVEAYRHNKAIEARQAAYQQRKAEKARD